MYPSKDGRLSRMVGDVPKYRRKYHKIRLSYITLDFRYSIPVLSFFLLTAVDFKTEEFDDGSTSCCYCQIGAFIKVE